MKEFLIALSASIAGAGLLALMIIGLHESQRSAKDQPKCELIASIKTDSYNSYGMVAFRRNLYLNQYRCGDKLKTIVE